jgi:hypothetical protein
MKFPCFWSSKKGMILTAAIDSNNAGMLGGPFQLSCDGIELNFATNYLGNRKKKGDRYTSLDS